MNNKWFSVLFLLAAAFVGFYLYNKYRVAPSINFSKLGFTDMEGKAVDFNSFKGRKLVVCFSATWCGNCWPELTAINKIKDAELPGVDVLVISDEPVERIVHFKEKLNDSFIYLKLNGSFASIGINSIPTTYIVNQNLEVTKEKVGYIDWEDLSTREHLKKLME